MGGDNKITISRITSYNVCYTKLLRLLFLCLVLVFFSNAKSQKNEITLKKDSVSFIEIIDNLEQQVDFKFFYNKEWVKDVVINEINYNSSSSFDTDDRNNFV